jgi:predicted metal-dependent HD superfamily phosphohydrolase
MNLLDRWVATAGADTEKAGRALLARYSEPHRRYHDQRHLAEVLDALDLLGGSRSVRLAAWFHDAVYDPQRDDNEDRSAELAVETVHALRGPPADVAEVARLIRLTAGHRPRDGDVDGAALCDADLAILGAAASRYDESAAAIRQEYRHLGDADFAAGRTAILADLVSREPLYRTDLGRQSWEAAAKINLRGELARWQGG